MSASDRDETVALSLQFDANGLIPAIIVDAADNTVLMFAFMNADALQRTIETNRVHFYSRSRNKLWMKGETSGETFAVDQILTDCDQDVLQVKVRAEGKGVACHTGRRSCFYRQISGGKLEFIAKPAAL